MDARTLEFSLTWIDSLLAEGEHGAKLRTDLPYFCEHALKLRPKTGPLEPFLERLAQGLDGIVTGQVGITHVLNMKP